MMILTACKVIIQKAEEEQSSNIELAQLFFFSTYEFAGAKNGAPVDSLMTDTSSSWVTILKHFLMDTTRNWH